MKRCLHCRLDHDLHFIDAVFPNRQHGNGKEVARYLANLRFGGIVVIHSRSEQARVMADILRQAKVCQFGDFDIVECSKRLLIGEEQLAEPIRMPSAGPQSVSTRALYLGVTS